MAKKVSRAPAQWRKDKRFKAVLKHLGDAVREARKANDLTQATLANGSDLTSKYISLIETGDTNPTLQSLVGLAVALGVEPGDLLPCSSDRNTRPLAQKCKQLVDRADNKQLKMMYELLKTASKQR